MDFRWPGVIPGICLLLTIGLYEQDAGVNGGMHAPIRFTERSTETPVYSAAKKEIIGILESDYPKVARNFAAIFPAATDQLWIKQDNALFAYFLNHNQKVSAVFNLGGGLNYAVTNIDAQYIPATVRKEIKSNYGSYDILSTREIILNDDTCYLVVLENNYEYISIRVTGNIVEETQRVIKSQSS